MTGMTVRDAFEAGIADYLEAMGTKNAPGATRAEKQPASGGCARHVIDVAYSDGYRVTVYCGINSPSSPKLVPTRRFRAKAQLLRALDTDYSRWTGNLELSIESPPRAAFGVYDHYRFTTNRDGRVDGVSSVSSAKR